MCSEVFGVCMSIPLRHIHQALGWLAWGNDKRRNHQQVMLARYKTSFPRYSTSIRRASDLVSHTRRYLVGFVSSADLLLQPCNGFVDLSAEHKGGCLFWRLTCVYFVVYFVRQTDRLDDRGESCHSRALCVSWTYRSSLYLDSLYVLMRREKRPAH